MTKQIQNYPFQKERVSASPHELRNPTWCAVCKIQINPGDECRETNRYWVCNLDACYEFTVHCEIYPHEGPIFYSQLYQHSRFLDAQRQRRFEGLEPLTWLDWCRSQGETIRHVAGVGFVSTFAKVHGGFPDRFRKPQLTTEEP